MTKAILVLNAGSSSIKFTVFDYADASGFAVRCEGQIEGIGTRPRFRVKDGAGASMHESGWENPPLGRGHAYALEQLAAFLDPLLPEHSLIGVGHRVVHGGPTYSAPVVIDAEVLHRLESYVPLAPLHQPANLAGIVLGARVPIILTSRADSVRVRKASCAVALIVAHARRPAKAAPAGNGGAA